MPRVGSGRAQSGRAGARLLGASDGAPKASRVAPSVSGDEWRATTGEVARQPALPSPAGRRAARGSQHANLGERSSVEVPVCRATPRSAGRGSTVAVGSGVRVRVRARRRRRRARFKESRDAPCFRRARATWFTGLRRRLGKPSLPRPPRHVRRPIGRCWSRDRHVGRLGRSARSLATRSTERRQYAIIPSRLIDTPAYAGAKLGRGRTVAPAASRANTANPQL